ncbi:kinase [Planoprotostelium fungivorum]|uniref:Kinase n=1 Tax=Planoprotostelium fungivorum TaxID=1890364 RepID=A0A2P6NSP8_9EUKA|nr:kinase [Planoprotostelium fungivorum]
MVNPLKNGSGEGKYRPQNQSQTRKEMVQTDAKLTIVEELEEGAFGKVFRANMGDKDVVLKSVSRAINHSQETVQKEYAFGMKLKHPNLIKMRSTFDTPDSHCLVMDLIEGVNFFQLVEDNGFRAIPETRVIKIFRGLAKGLEYSHSMGVAHMDIKLENIMLSSDDHVTLIDFGLAVEGTTCEQYRGSPDYASPERWMDQPYDTKPSDVWSLGVVLFVLLTGSMPFESSEYVAKMKESTKSFPWPRGVEISQDVKELCASMLEYNPADRPTMKEVLKHKWLSKPTLLQRLSPKLSRRTTRP